ncbi:type I protein arginine N-methyltransferase Rmt1 [Ascosphaera pollenicola]|nr:type I protein arginine N-methyltransferase Rmt1 [Ascosphaera pollenicola]
MLWDCPSECDYTCQHIVVDQRLSANHPNPIVQFHGKWPFYRFLGCQELFSTFFSVLNFLAHKYGMERIRESIPRAYPLRRYYLAFGYFGLASWTFSTIFHTRDFPLTEKLDYFGAGASVMYGMYLAVIRIYRLELNDGAYKPTIRRFWTVLCVVLYLAHISYLSFWRFDYTYNMAANVVVGIIHNVLWTAYSVMRYRQEYKSWTAWPGFLITDAENDIIGQRLKA